VKKLSSEDSSIELSSVRKRKKDEKIEIADL